jgi:hypothetical protein
MDTAKGHGNVRFHKTQLEPVEEVTVETMQKMYQAAVGSRAAVTILEFIKRRGCEIVDGLVINPSC